MKQALILRAIGQLPSAWTGSINEAVRFSSLPHLRAMERAGIVKVIDGPHGQLGYKWALTARGREALRAVSNKSAG